MTSPETPVDIEIRCPNMRRGAIKDGNYTPMQLGYNRPNTECSSFKTPIAGVMPVRRLHLYRRHGHRRPWICGCQQGSRGHGPEEVVEADACHGEIHQDLHGVMTLWLALGPKAERDVWFKDCEQRKRGSTWRSRIY